MSKLSVWVKKHGRPFQIKAKNGEGTVSVQFHDGYVVIVGSQPGLRAYRQEVKVVRSAWLQLLRGAVAPTRLMEGPDFDPNLAEREYLQQERLHLEALRQEKRERRQVSKSDAQKRRYLRAQARSEARAKR